MVMCTSNELFRATASKIKIATMIAKFLYAETALEEEVLLLRSLSAPFCPLNVSLIILSAFPEVALKTLWTTTVKTCILLLYLSILVNA